jgi:hypothetical protein
MRYGRYGWSHLALSWGLGITFLWIGLHMFQNPDTWIGFVPEDIPGELSRESALQATALFDTLVGILLILRWWQKTVAFLATLHLAVILLQNGIDALLVRDVGLFGAAVALLLWPTKYRRHRLAKMLRGGKKDYYDE